MIDFKFKLRKSARDKFNKLKWIVDAQNYKKQVMGTAIKVRIGLKLLQTLFFKKRYFIRVYLPTVFDGYLDYVTKKGFNENKLMEDVSEVIAHEYLHCVIGNITLVPSEYVVRKMMDEKE